MKFKKLSVFLPVLLLVSMTPVSAIAFSVQPVETVTQAMPNPDAEYQYEVISGDFTFTITDDDDNDKHYAGLTGCDSSVTSVEIPAEIDGFPVKYLGDAVFTGCENLTAITTAENQEYFTSIDGVLYNKETTRLEACPVTKTSLTLPDNCTQNIIYALKWHDNLQSISVSENHAVYSSADGILYNKEGTILLYYPPAKSDETFTVPERVTEFSICNIPALKTLIIPEGVTTLWNNIQNCKNLETVYLPASVTEITSGIFEHCDNLKDIYYAGTWENSLCNFPHLLTKATVHYEASEIMSGDADGSGKVDILDMIIVNKAILGKENLSENGLKAIDFNGNGKPDSDESLKLLKYIVGLIEDFT